MPKRNTDTKKWDVDFYPNGRTGKRVRKKGFDTKAEAANYESYVKGEAIQKPWEPQASDNRKLSDLLELWYSAHGQHLKAHKQRKSACRHIIEKLNNPIARLLTPSEFTDYRSRCIAEGTQPKTCNNHLGYINAIYNELERTGVIKYSTPLKTVRPIKLAERELSWLTESQIKTLLATADNDKCPHTRLIIRVCLATGARWGESHGLNYRTVRNGQVHFTDTKSKRNRSIPLPPDLYSDLETHLKEHKRFPMSYKSSAKSFDRILAATDITLPRGQATHVLRHTFASHFMMNNGNVLTLQKILGHASIAMTMRYAHLSPDHLQDAATLNPLVKM